MKSMIEMSPLLLPCISAPQKILLSRCPQAIRRNIWAVTVRCQFQPLLSNVRIKNNFISFINSMTTKRYVDWKNFHGPTKNCQIFSLLRDKIKVIQDLLQLKAHFSYRDSTHAIAQQPPGTHKCFQQHPASQQCKK